MISAFVSKDAVSEFLKQCDFQALAYYKGLIKEGRVRVFYHFSGEQIEYVAYYQNDYAMVNITLAGKVTLMGSDFALALLIYIKEVDGSGDEEKLQSLYGNDYPTLSLYAKLGPSKAKSLLEVSDKVDTLAAKIESSNRLQASKQPSLRFIIDISSKTEFIISLRIGFTKLYINRKMGAFLRDYYSGTPVSIQKEYVNLRPNSFPEKIEKALQFVYNRAASSYYFNTNYPIHLDVEDTVDLLFLLSGEEVDYDDVTMPILPVEKVSLKLLEDGSLESSLPFKKKGLKRVGSRAMCVTEQGIELYEFVSSSAGEVYEFFKGLKGLDASFIAEELARKVLPILGEHEIEVSPEFEAKHPILRPKIEYYVGLEDNGGLSYQTKLYIGHEEVDPHVFSSFSQETGNRYQAFIDELHELDLPANGRNKDEDAVVTFLAADLLNLKTYANVFISEELQGRKLISAPSLSLRTSSGQDWFEVKLYSSGYSEEELLQLYNAYTRKKRFVRLRNEYVMLDKGAEDFRKLSESFDPSSIGVQLPLYQALKIPYLGGEMDDHVKELIENVENYGRQQLGPLPAPIEKVIRPYQRTGIQFLYNLYQLGLSGILSDDMGLGKTLQSFGLFSLIEDDKPMLVVSPKSLIYNWMQERNKWFPKLKAYILTGTPSERKALYAKMKKGGKAVYFVSYDTLRNDLDHVLDVDFSIVLLDEGQYIANANAKKSRAVKEIKARSRFALTGTPVQNSLMDLWSIFDFLLPGYFPPLAKFKDLYGGLEFASEEARKRLLVRIKPFLLGRKKKDVLAELPDKENVVMSLAMGDDQLKVYESYLAQAREMLSREDTNKINLLSMMTRLRQICISPSLFLEGEFGSAKIDALVSMLASLKASGRRAIVFSSFVGALEMVQSKCKEAGLNSESITGETSAKVRVILAERFNKSDSNIDVMLVSLKAGGTGLNLIGADTVFHLDPWWNLAAERQAEDRAHRIGQKNKVTVFKLVVQDTIEEKVLALQEKKGLLIDLTDEASLESFLTEEDYKFLLS